MKKILSLFVLLAASTPGFAQTASSMTGTVTDAKGALLPDTTVTLVNGAAGVGLIYATDKDGRYRFPSVPAGTGYIAIFAHAGFASLRISNITLSVGTTRLQNAVLTAGKEVIVDLSASPPPALSFAPSTSSPWRTSRTPSSQQEPSLPLVLSLQPPS